jgi:alpha-amylase/alpha-mannosidase (GH57 family)
MTVFWAPLLHIYQPPTQEIEILKKINQECYIPLFSTIDNYDNAKFTLNISGCLVNLLYEYGMADTMDRLKNLVSENKIEILGTAKYHPILPLIPEKEILHQIGMNEEINRKEFGNIWEKKGFFPPELAVSPKVTKIVYKLGYKWIIMSGIACPVEEKEVDWPYDKIYCSPNGLQLYFRDDILSNKIAFKKTTAKDFIKSLRKIFISKEDHNELHDKVRDRYVLTAVDGETFGWHVKNYEKVFLGKVLELILNSENSDDNNLKFEEKIKVVFISELENYFPISNKNINPRDSSWSASYEDIINKIPYPLWNHPENSVHKFYWKIVKSLNNLMNLAGNLDFTGKWEIENYYNTARWFYDRGLHSCPLWWSNSLHGMWSPNLIYNGMELLIKASLNAQLALVNAGIDSGDGYFDSISYYHGLLLMELYSITKKNLKK